MSLHLDRAVRAACLALPALLGAAPAAAELAAPVCRVGPFVEPTVGERTRMARQECRADNLQWAIEPRPQQPAVATPGPLKATIERLWSDRLVAGVNGTVKFGWAGRHVMGDSGLRTDRAVVAAGSTVPLTREFWLQVNIGREVGPASARNRASMASVWQPFRSSTLVAEWAADQGAQLTRKLSGRYWLLPKRLALDLGARYEPDGLGGVDPRVGLIFSVAP